MSRRIADMSKADVQDVVSKDVDSEKSFSSTRCTLSVNCPSPDKPDPFKLSATLSISMDEMLGWLKNVRAGCIN